MSVHQGTPAWEPGKLGCAAATKKPAADQCPEPYRSTRGPLVRREIQWPENCRLDTNLAPAGAGRERWWNQKIPFYCGPSHPFPGCPLVLTPRKRKQNTPRVSQRCAGVRSSHGTAGTPVRPGSGPSRRQGTRPILGDSRGSRTRAVRSPSSGRRPRAPLGFSLRWCHMSSGRVGTQGVGGGVRARRGPPSPPICTETRLTDARNSQ